MKFISHNLVTSLFFLLLILCFSVIEKWNTLLLGINLKREKFSGCTNISSTNECWQIWYLKIASFLLRFHYVKYLQISKFKPTKQGALRDNSSDFCPFLLFSTSLFKKPFLSVWGLSFHCYFWLYKTRHMCAPISILVTKNCILFTLISLPLFLKELLFQWQTLWKALWVSLADTHISVHHLLFFSVLWYSHFQTAHLRLDL